MTTNKPTVLVTLAPAVRETVEGRLGELARIVFLAELPEAQRRDALEGAEYLLTLNPQREFGPWWPQQPRWRFVQFTTAGVDHVDFTRIPAETIVASNVGGFAEPMAEYVLATALALSKKLLHYHRLLQQGVFAQFGETGTLRGKTVTILGFGGIGHACAKLLALFDVRLFAINRSGKTDVPVWRCGTLADLEDALRLADVVVVCLPLNRDTRGLLEARELGWLKDDAIFINVARGEIVDEKALYDFLLAHPKAQAAIDAWWVEPFRHGEFRMNYPFLDLPNVLGSPHNSARIPGWERVALERACDNLARALEGAPVHGLVNRRDYL